MKLRRKMDDAYQIGMQRGGSGGDLSPFLVRGRYVEMAYVAGWVVGCRDRASSARGEMIGRPLA